MGGSSKTTPAPPSPEYQSYMQSYSDNTDYALSDYATQVTEYNTRSNAMYAADVAAQPVVYGSKGGASPRPATLAEYNAKQANPYGLQPGGFSYGPSGGAPKAMPGTGPDTNVQYYDKAGAAPTKPGMLTEQQYYDRRYADQQKAYQEKVAVQKAAEEKQMAELKAEQERLVGEEKTAQAAKIAKFELDTKTNNRDSMLADRANAESASVDYVNSQIDRERSNASLFGIKYEVSDEQKTARISDYFSGIWEPKNDASLEALFSDIGKPQGFEDFAVKRGEGTYQDPYKKKAKQKVVSKSRGTAPGRNPTLIGTELGGSETVLGG